MMCTYIMMRIYIKGVFNDVHLHNDDSAAQVLSVGAEALDSYVTAGAASAPNLARVPASNPTPATATTVPPEAGPRAGLAEAAGGVEESKLLARLKLGARSSPAARLPPR